MHSIPEGGMNRDPIILLFCTAWKLHYKNFREYKYTACMQNFVGLLIHYIHEIPWDYDKILII